MYSNNNFGLYGNPRYSDFFGKKARQKREERKENRQEKKEERKEKREEKRTLKNAKKEAEIEEKKAHSAALLAMSQNTDNDTDDGPGMEKILVFGLIGVVLIAGVGYMMMQRNKAAMLKPPVMVQAQV